MSDIPAADGGLLQEISYDECLRLLATQPVGRLAVARGEDGPLVVPVNFALDGDEILFRTGLGSKLNLARGARVSFQVDAVDLLRHTGWSVLVTGRAYEATGWQIDRRGLVAWAGAAKDHWVRIVIGEVSGRRISPGELPPLDGRGYL